MMVLLNGFVGTVLAPSQSLATLAMGTMVAGTALCTIPAARLAAKKGRRLGFILGAGLCSVGALLSAFAIWIESFFLFCATSMLFGGTMAFLLQMRFAAAESVSLDKVSLAVSMILFAGIGAAFIGPRVGVWASGWIESVPYVGAFLALAALALIAGVILAFYQDQARPQQQEQRVRLPLRALCTGRFLLGVLCGVTSFGVMALIMTATPISMHNHQGISLEDTSLVIQLHIVAMFLPSLFTGYLIQRLGVQWVALAGLLCNFVCVYFALSGMSFTYYLTALVFLGLGWNGLFMAGTQMIATSHTGPERFQAQAINDFVVFGIQGVASLSAGLLLAWVGWQGLNFIGFSLLMICLAGWFHLVFIKQTFAVGSA